MSIRNPHVEVIDIAILKPNPNNARTHSKAQIESLAHAISTFGYSNPVIIDNDNIILAGHGRVEAVKSLGLTQVPIIRMQHLTKDMARAFAIADNRLAELSGLDKKILAIEIQELSLVLPELDLTVTGYVTAELDNFIISDGVAEEGPVPTPDNSRPPISCQGDLWLLGNHRLLCGNAVDSESYARLLEGKRAQMVFTDPPYNVPIDGHVSGKGKNRHAEFVMASGEMTEAEFSAFLRQFMQQAATHSTDGSIHYICMDWRHLYDLLATGRDVYTDLKNICVWNKTNGGMGSLYRSKHEMICVFKNGKAPHINNIQLGKHGRYRSNVWDYAGQTTPHGKRDEELAMHPTVKPLQLVIDAILDCSDRNGVVLDSFGGSGTTLIAAEQTDRHARLIELDPRYADVTIRRWQELTKQQAIQEGTGSSFVEVEQVRNGDENER